MAAEKDPDVDVDTTADDTDQGDTDASTEPEPLLKEDGTPFTATDLKALTEALNLSRKEVRRYKRNGTAKPPDGDQDGTDTPDVEQVKAAALAEADGKWKPLVVRAAARSAFAEAGLVLPKTNADGAMARVLKLLDVDDLDVSADGQVDGLREQVAEIKADFPELFSSVRRPARVDATDQQDTRVPKSAVDRLTAQIMAS